MHPQPHQLPRHPVVAVAERPRAGNARVGDADREGVAELLADAAAAGYLRLDELDERLSAVWSATTSGELSAAESDLLVELRSARTRARPPVEPAPPLAPASYRTSRRTPQ